MQSGSNDCGIFSIAYATTIAYGEDPQKYVYDQEKMRRHLYICFTKGILTPFPVKTNAGPVKSTAIESIDIHCYCRMPELKDIAMIECTNCKRWYHNVCCDNIPKECMDDSRVEWLCNFCAAS